MNLSINARNMDINPRLQSYVEKKTGRLDRYMPNLAEVRVDLAEQKARNAVQRQVAQITVRDNRGTILRMNSALCDRKVFRSAPCYLMKRLTRWNCWDTISSSFSTQRMSR